MDENSENIISVCNGNKEIADEAFVELMALTEKCLNDKAKSNQDKYKNCGGKAMENEAAKAMIEVAPSTPFRNAKIEVVSGARFPDIQAGVYYGVEVKTTKGNKWKSVGSSIVESTRIKEVSMIYMLFGKLGGEFAEFRCKPYEDCLDNISLTHQPRYQIDMELEEKQQATIFQKMKTDYNAFRLYDEKEKIQMVRQYFRSTAKEGKEMSWWIGEEESETTVPMTIRFLNDASKEEKRDILARMFILFPELLSNKTQTKYKRAILWLCSRRALLCSNIRDFFSSGGQVEEIGKRQFDTPVSKVIKKLFMVKDDILNLLNHPDEAIIDDISEFWRIECQPVYYRIGWVTMMQNICNNTPGLEEINIEEMLEEW